MITTAPHVETATSLERYAESLRQIALQLASLGVRVHAAAGEPAGSSVYAGIRADLKDTIRDFARIGTEGFQALLWLPGGADPLAWKAQEFTGRASELHTSWEWVGFIPTPGVKDPWEFGFTSADHVAEAVWTDLVRQAGDTLELSRSVDSLAMRVGEQ
jgi:hypothetical protein